MHPYSEILQEIEAAFWDQDVRVDEGIARPYTYDDDTFRACVKIFMSALMWKLWEEQERLELNIDKRSNEAVSVGNELYTFIKNWTGINTKELYK